MRTDNRMRDETIAERNAKLDALQAKLSRRLTADLSR